MILLFTNDVMNTGDDLYRNITNAPNFNLKDEMIAKNTRDNDSLTQFSTGGDEYMTPGPS